MGMKALLAIGVTALVAASPVEARETPAEAAAREASNRDFVLKHYPPRARAAGEQGRVYFTVTLDRDARLTSCEVTRSSGFPLLDEETCELMVAHAVFKRVTDANGRLVRNPTHEGAINWKLPEGEASAATPQKLASLARPERLVCRRISKTGSLAATERRCLTQRQWDQGDQYARDEVRRLQDAVNPRGN